MTHPLLTAAAIMLATLGVSAPLTAAPEPPVTVTYVESTDVIANPQRGFYRYTDTHYRADGSGYTPLDPADLAGYRADGITQILRVFYLEKFVANPVIDPAYLALVQADYDIARAAGVSVITRFAYVEGGPGPYLPPYGDAPVAVVLAHIDQLGPVLNANADVIPVVQSGFIGLWGEGYYTDHFVADPADPDTITPQDWANRSAVTQALLDVLPDDRGVQVRTMQAKQEFLGVPSGAASAVTASEAFTAAAIARIGHHNDCFLASADDLGTFLSDPITLDQQYLAAESVYVPVGGETCALNPPRSDWPTAADELARYHYSYLNLDFNEDVLDSWGAAQLDEAAQRLGYRFVMVSSTVTPQADGSAVVSVDVRNDGWAAPYTPRDAELRLTPAGGAPVKVSFSTGADARRWLPGTTTTLTATIQGVPDGSYALALALPAVDPGTRTDPRFAIRTANVGTWDDSAGVNELMQTVVVRSSAVTPATLAPTGLAVQVSTIVGVGAAALAAILLGVFAGRRLRRK